MNIPDEPDRPVCAAHGPLTWLYGKSKQGYRWISFTFEPDRRLLPHVCDDPDLPQVRWFPSEVVAERAHRGAALARAVLAGENPFITEEEERRG
ncbi:hypothetical protein ACQP1P_38735 [Dactylosporangium sp. CA-052675]|uniref:hypothetical protein n=1 Tax=Dactylosporangium sp. CA-052675 TaxID=3239927 RepID=UPI003D91FEBC